MRNKLLLSLVLAAASSSVFAMPYEPMDHCGILELALTGGGFKTSTDNTAYGLSVNDATNLGVEVLKNDPEYKFGGTVLLGYYFPNSTFNVDASWTGTRNRLNDSNLGTVTGLSIAPDTTFADALAASSSYHYDYDFVNVEVGSLTRVNLNGLIINPQVGLSYARIKENQNISYGDVLDSDGDFALDGIGVSRHSSLRGFGPSIGVDLNYVVCLPVNFFGNFRYNALVGDIHSSGSANFGATTTSVSYESEKTLISLFQSELGVGYDFNFCNMFCGNFAIGYQLTKAINSGERVTFIDSEVNTFADNLFDSSIHGWFARLTMDFNV